MLGTLDDQIAASFAGSSLLLALLLSFVLGLRHATDPDHLVAVTALLAGTDDGRGSRAARRLGAAWGLGHALSLLAFGLPIVLFRALLPEPLQRAAEAGIGVLIAFLAIRLLVRWRRGGYHVHDHRHGAGTRHVHLHAHARSAAHVDDRHDHRPAPARAPRQSFAIGLAHGMGGSAGVGLLLVASIPDRAVAAAAVLVLAIGTAVSMTILTGLLGRAMAGPRFRIEAFAPVAGGASLLFGVWYATAAYELVAYPF